MTDEPRIDDHTRTVECPHCRERFFVSLGVEITGTRKTARGHDAWRDALTPEEVAWLDHARSIGLVDAFTAAVEGRVDGQSKPVDMERYLFTFLKLCARKQPNADVHRALVREWGVDYQLWSALGLVAIVAGGMFRAFAPLTYVAGHVLKKLSGNTAGAPTRIMKPEQVSDWIRTRFGYVPHASATASLLQQRSIGAFGRLVQ
jgi:hypothetical protein